jgi:uncharacterized membrane protein YbhN (UPF0104 family)
MSAIRAKARRLAAVLVSIALIALLLVRVDPTEVLAALLRGRWLQYTVVAAAFTLIWLAIDSVVLARLVTRFHRPISPREMLPLRGASYLLMAISYDAAQAGLGLALHRRYGIPALAMGGTYLFYYLVDVATIATLGVVGSGSVPGPLGATLRPALAAVLAAVLAVFALLELFARTPEERVPRWLLGTRLLATLRRATPRDVLEFVGWRALFYASFIAFAALSLPAFGVHVPLRALIALVPVAMSLSALPVTVAGIGSTQVAMWALYGPFGERASVLAYSLVYGATLVLFRLPIALACLPAASDVLARRELHWRTET